MYNPPHIAFDIETLALEISEKEREDKLESLRKRYKSEDVIKEHLAKWEDSFCFDPMGAKLLAIGLWDSYRDEYHYHASDNPNEVILFFYEILQKQKGKPKLVGFNCKKFDIPILCVAGAKANLISPFFFGRFDIIDLITDGMGYHLGPKSLNYYAKLFGMESKNGSGDEVKELWENNKDKLKEYCLNDVRIIKELLSFVSSFYAL